MHRLTRRQLVIVGNIILVLVVSGVFWWWLRQEVSAPVLSITAPLDVPEEGIPVYAQFTATQTVVVANPVRLTHITIPVYFLAETTEPLVVELWRHETLVTRWRYLPEQTGMVTTARLSLEPPRLVDGEMAIRFSSATVTHEEKETAPRLFVQKADTYYPAGNYYIAQNQKSGDLALALYAKDSNLAVLWGEARERPWRTAQRKSPWLLVALLIVMAPHPFLAEIHRPGKEKS